MRIAILVLSVVVTALAEAPYHLPRPAPQQPSFHYPSRPAPLPPPPPQQPIPQYPQFPQSSGYNYPIPNIAPTFIPQAPQQQYSYPQPAPIQPVYQQPAPVPINYPQPIYQQPQPQPQPQSHPNYYQPPSTSYGVPQPRYQPIQQFPAYIPPQPTPQYQPQQVYQRQQFYQPQSQPGLSQVYQQQQQYSSQNGYAYQQPQPRIQYPTQFSSQLPLQSQSVTSGLSSYQADSNQYSGAHEQIHKDALDSVVVNRVQDLIKDNEHSTAKHAGYLSLVSGVSLENAKPSIELSSFTQTSPLRASLVSSSSASVSSGSSLSRDYGLPSASTGQSSDASSFSFLPNNKPSSSYGSPN